MASAKDSAKYATTDKGIATIERKRAKEKAKRQAESAERKQAKRITSATAVYDGMIGICEDELESLFTLPIEVVNGNLVASVLPALQQPLVIPANQVPPPQQQETRDRKGEWIFGRILFLDDLKKAATYETVEEAIHIAQRLIKQAGHNETILPELTRYVAMQIERKRYAIKLDHLFIQWEYWKDKRPFAEEPNRKKSDDEKKFWGTGLAPHPFEATPTPFAEMAAFKEWQADREYCDAEYRASLIWIPPWPVLLEEGRKELVHDAIKLWVRRAHLLQMRERAANEVVRMKARPAWESAFASNHPPKTRRLSNDPMGATKTLLERAHLELIAAQDRLADAFAQSLLYPQEELHKMQFTRRQVELDVIEAWVRRLETNADGQTYISNKN